MSFTTGPYAAQGRRLLNDAREIVPENTKLAYANFQEEFKGFCDAKHANDQFPHCVTEEKLFGFLWYQAYRNRRPRNLKHNTFDVDDYERVVAAHPPNRDTLFNQEDLQANNYPGYSTWEKARSAVMNLAMQQRSQSSNNSRPLDFKTDRLESLKRFVRIRTPHIKEARFDEKMDEKTTPYRMIEYVIPLETKFWEHRSHHLKESMVSLRNRLFYLFTLTGVLRGESMCRLCLSDLYTFFYHARQEPHPYHILLAQIRIGKNTPRDGTGLLGRVIRHKDVNMCAIGALAFYLLTRFEVTHETFDLRQNENWFQIKLIANINDNTKAVKNKEYADAIKGRLASLGLTGCHAIHFGRSEGPKMMELEELDSTNIQCLGNWSPGVYEKFYSCKLPIKAMRVSNGHAEEKGCHFNPRTAVEPPQALCQLIFPFIETSEAQLDSITDSEQRGTAWTFLHMMKSLRKVVLQDSAVMMIAGRTHAIFNHHPVFHHPSFATFKNEMAAALNAAPAEDPLNVTLERMMPAVLHHFGNLASARNQDRAFANEQFGFVHQKLEMMDQRLGHCNQQMRQGFSNIEQSQANFVTVEYMQGMLAHASTYTPQTTSRATMMPRIQQHRHATIGPTASQLPLPRNVIQQLPATPLVAHRQGASASAAGNTTTTLNAVPNNVPKPRSIYRSATEMFDDWYGLGSATRYPPGGVDRLDHERNGWRNSYTTAERKQHSRLKYVITEINRKIEQYKSVGHDNAAARKSSLNFFDSLMREQRSCHSLSGMERYLKKKMKDEREAQNIEQAYEQAQLNGGDQEVV